MKKIERKETKKTGVLRETAKLSFERICLYILIFGGCAIAMLFNLNRNAIGLWALTQGTESERNLLLLTAAVVAVCLVFVAALIRALIQKKTEMKQESAGRLKATYNHSGKK